MCSQLMYNSYGCKILKVHSTYNVWAYTKVMFIGWNYIHKLYWRSDTWTSINIHSICILGWLSKKWNISWIHILLTVINLEYVSVRAYVQKERRKFCITWGSTTADNFFFFIFASYELMKLISNVVGLTFTPSQLE